jgi:hypothetical protein
MYGGNWNPPMPETAAPHSAASRIMNRPLTWPFVLAAALVTLAFIGTIVLWAHYGTAVFFETIRAGFAACFG